MKFFEFLDELADIPPSKTMTIACEIDHFSAVSRKNIKQFIPMRMSVARNRGILYYSYLFLKTSTFEFSSAARHIYLAIYVIKFSNENHFKVSHSYSINVNITFYSAESNAI